MMSFPFVLMGLFIKTEDVSVCLFHVNFFVCRPGSYLWWLCWSSSSFSLFFGIKHIQSIKVSHRGFLLFLEDLTFVYPIVSWLNKYQCRLSLPELCEMHPSNYLAHFKPPFPYHFLQPFQVIMNFSVSESQESFLRINSVLNQPITLFTSQLQMHILSPQSDSSSSIQELLFSTSVFYSTQHWFYVLQTINIDTCWSKCSLFLPGLDEIPGTNCGEGEDCSKD